MSIGQDIKVTIQNAICYSKAYLPLFSQELVNADSDSIQAVMTSSDKVRVFRQQNWLFRSSYIGFEPLETPSNKGFILYPDAFVRAKFYTPIARAIADPGDVATVTPSPLDISLATINLGDATTRYDSREYFGAFEVVIRISKFV